MTNHQKGYRRDRLVLETLNEWGTMDTEQLRILFYPSTRVAQRRLSILTCKGKVKRYRDAIEMPYAYFINKYDYSRLMLNWVRIWILKRLPTWEMLENFDFNTATIRNTFTNAIKTYTVLHNATRKTWIDDNVIIIYDTDEQKRAAVKRTKGTLLTINDIKEGLECREI